MFCIQYLTNFFTNIIFCRLASFILLQLTIIPNGVSAVDYSTLGVSDPGILINMGLTEVPTNIPCTLITLDLPGNLITSIGAASFTCLNRVQTLDLSNNKLTYISTEAFDPMESLESVHLRYNKDLPQLPPSYGPNTANLRSLYIQDINLQIIPTDSYFDQMMKLEVIAIAIDLSNDFFEGWTDLKTLYSYGNLAPNLTGRSPNIERIDINKAFPAKNIPTENVLGLTKLKRFKIVGCDKLPLFKESVALSHLEVDSCKITSLPDYRHLVSLHTFDPDTSKFHCDLQSCWMLFETILPNSILYPVVENIVCHGPEKFEGLSLRQLSPVQLGCFKGQSGKYFILKIHFFTKRPLANISYTILIM